MTQKQGLAEYLRRNLLHAKAVGVVAGIDSARKRLNQQKRAPQWLMKSLVIECHKAEAVAHEMAAHRDEMWKYADRLHKSKGA